MPFEISKTSTEVRNLSLKPAESEGKLTKNEDDLLFGLEELAIVKRGLILNNRGRICVSDWGEVPLLFDSLARRLLIQHRLDLSQRLVGYVVFSLDDPRRLFL